MLLVSGCKGNHFFRNAKTFSGKICIRLQKSCKNDAPAPPQRLLTVATAPSDGRRPGGARRRQGATPPQGHATGPVSGCRKARLARQRRPFCKSAPHAGGKQLWHNALRGRRKGATATRLRPRRPPAHAMPTATPPDTPEPPQNGLAHAPAMHLLPERFASVAHLL